MSESSVLVSLPQMVDLALNCPEIGAVNFNILHSLLHVLIQQVDLMDCKVEFKGGESDRVQTLLATSKQRPSINLTEYIVSPSKGEQQKVVMKKQKLKKAKESFKEVKGKDVDIVVEHELKVIDQRKDSREIPREPPTPLASTSVLDGDDVLQTVVVVEPADAAATHVSVALSRAHFDTLEEELDKLRIEIQELKELPTSLGLIDALRSQGQTDKSTPVMDMFQILNLQKRVDATEAGISKLANIVEDLAKEGIAVERATSGTHHGGSPHGGHGSKKEESAAAHGEGKKGEHDKPAGHQTTDKPSASGKAGTKAKTKAGTKGKTGDATKTDGEEKKAEEQSQVSVSADESAYSDDGTGGTRGKRKGAKRFGGDDTSQTSGMTGSDIPSDVSHIYETDTRLHELEKRVKKLEDVTTIRSKEEGDKGKGESTAQQQRLDVLEVRFTECVEQVTALDSMFNNQIAILQNQFTELEREIGEVIERVNAGMPGGDTGADQNISELYDKIMALQEDMENMAATAAKLLEDKEERQSNMDAILEQIELLKTIKANREDLEDALADKADTCAVNRKVSHDQFDAACDDLSRGIEDALSKLTQQEQLWQQALDDIQREIENKLDKMELTPLRDFVHNKLKMLQDRLKVLATLKKETEAAGTKSKYLRNVNCISCDKEVIMRKHMDTSLLPPPPALPPTKSMGPYLAYELDALRKQQKCAPHSRNLNHFESAITGGRGGRGDEDHICNRYCGGSHTVTTPQQRVARLGHFLQQWGPELQPLSEGQIRGTDGQLYKSREGEDVGQSSPEHRDSEELPDTSGKSRPSMVVHGDIIAARSALKSAASKASEGERPSLTKGDSQRASVNKDTPGSKRASRQSQQANSNPRHSSRISFKGGEDQSAPAETATASEAGDPASAAATAGGSEAPPAEVGEPAAGEPEE